MSTTTLARTAPADETIDLSVKTDLLRYLSTNEHEVIVTGRYGNKSYTLSYHGPRTPVEHSDAAAIWGLTVVVNDQTLHGRAVTRHVAEGDIIEIGEHTVYVEKLQIMRAVSF